MRILTILGLVAILCWSPPLGAQETASDKLRDWKITPEEAARENPLKPEKESLEQGRVLFESQCGMCHGVKGDGKGSLASVLEVEIPSFTNPETLKGLSDGAVLAMITKGKDKMPGGEGRLTDEQKWKMINYIRTLPAGGTTQGASPSQSVTPPAPAPKETKENNTTKPS
ncbi:MAG: cytochrome c [Acidobacteria bacterium]|nr:cytochrome c [Acidobacteriota bacterium]